MDVHQLLAQWNNTKVSFPHDSLLHAVFEELVHQLPEALAVIFENEQLTYSELNDRSNQIAHHLQKLGLRPEIPVGIYMERSPELIIAIFGILKAGGVCVPLDPSYPQEQLDFVLTDTGLTIVLTQNKFLKNLSNKTLTLIAMDSWVAPTSLEVSTPQDPRPSKNLAFIFYTSGSTGNPKGVMLSHRAVHSHIFWRKKAFDLTRNDRHLLRASIGFAFLLTEVFTPLLTGGAIVIVRPGAHQDNAYLINLIAERKVTIVNLVPSQIRVLLEEQDFDKCISLRHCVTGGETLPLWLQKRFFCPSGCWTQYYLWKHGSAKHNFLAMRSAR